MIILKMQLLLRGVKGVDKYLEKSNVLHTLTSSEAQAFFAAYLNKKFDPTNKSYFKIFTYLKKRNVFSENQVEELLLSSNYFNTMPTTLAFPLLKELKLTTNYKLKKFVSKYIAMINDPYDLKVVSEMYPEFKELYASKIVASHDIEYILSYKKKPKITANIISCMDNTLSFSDMKKYILNCKMDAKSIFKLLNPYFNQDKKAVLDFIFITYQELYLYRNDMDDNIFFNALNNNPNITRDDKDYLAQRVLNIKWKDAHISWLNNVDCFYNFTYLNKIVEASFIDLDFILSLKIEYYRYLRTKLFNRGQEFMDALISTVLSNLNQYNRELINEIIMDCACNLSSFTLNKKEIFSLLMWGADDKVITKIFQDYDFDEFEKIEIFRIFRSLNRDDLIINWGAFLFNNINIKEDTSIRRLA